MPILRAVGPDDAAADAVRLPSAVVEALDLKAGDQIEIRIAGKREFEVRRDRSKEHALARLRRSFTSTMRQSRPMRSQLRARHSTPKICKTGKSSTVA